MATITIDDKKIEYTGTPNIIDLAKEHEIDIPHFCYHPGLSVSGNCRMCVVEVGMPVRNRESGQIEKDESGNDKISFMPKPQPGCYQTPADGMVIRTTTDKIVEARKAILEYILANHPLDCPVCDQAGECVLQDYAYQYGFQKSEFIEQKRTYSKKEISDVITPEMNRCIHCDRCSRFTKEIAKDFSFSRTWRGNQLELATLPGEKISHNLQGNMVDICPVGALTLTDFRFKSRVWFLRYGPSICTSCAKGCNVVVWYKDEQVYRIKPRYNEKVNSYWMCDHGRLRYKFLNTNRNKTHKIHGEETTLEKAIDKAASLIKNASSIGVIASAAESVESNYVVSKFFKEVHATPNVDFRLAEAQIKDDHSLVDGELLLAKDPYPNSQGARKAGLLPGNGGLTAEAMLANPDKVDLLIVFLDDKLQKQNEKMEKLANAKKLILISPYTCALDGKAEVVFATKAHTESYGTFINVDGIQQQYEPVWNGSGAAVDTWKLFNELAAKMGKNFGFQKIETIRTNIN